MSVSTALVSSLEVGDTCVGKYSPSIKLRGGGHVSVSTALVSSLEVGDTCVSKYSPSIKLRGGGHMCR